MSSLNNNLIKISLRVILIIFLFSLIGNFTNSFEFTGRVFATRDGCFCNDPARCFPDGCTGKPTKDDRSICSSYRYDWNISSFFCVDTPPCCQAMIEQNDANACCWPERGWCKENVCKHFDPNTTQCGWYWTKQNGYGCWFGDNSAYYNDKPASIPTSPPTVPTKPPSSHIYIPPVDYSASPTQYIPPPTQPPPNPTAYQPPPTNKPPVDNQPVSTNAPPWQPTKPGITSSPPEITKAGEAVQAVKEVINNFQTTANEAKINLANYAKEVIFNPAPIGPTGLETPPTVDQNEQGKPLSVWEKIVQFFRNFEKVSLP